MDRAIEFEFQPQVDALTFGEAGVEIVAGEQADSATGKPSWRMAFLVTALIRHFDGARAAIGATGAPRHEDGEANQAAAHVPAKRHHRRTRLPHPVFPSGDRPLPWGTGRRLVRLPNRMGGPSHVTRWAALVFIDVMHLRRRLSTPLLILGLASTSLTAIAATPVVAMDDASTVDIDTLDMVPVRTWGVSGLNPAETQTPSLDVLVWDFAQIGNRMFVGGAFLNVQESKYATPIPQSFVAAFDIDSGDWIDTWTPQLDRAVYSLDVLPNGSLLVGGEFETVNGVTRRGLVGLDPITGAIDPSFAGTVDRPWSEKRATVREVKVEADGRVYAAGNFSHLDGAGGSRTRVFKAGRFANGAGVLDATWKPEITGSGIWGLDTDPSRGEVHLSGFFSAANGEAETGYLHTVDDSTGATAAGKLEVPRNYPASQPEFYDVVTGDDTVFAIGEQHVTQVLDADDHAMLGWHTTGANTPTFEYKNGFAGGAFQAGERIGDIVFAGCHCTWSTRNGIDSHFSSFDGQRTPHRLVMAYDATTGELLDQFTPDINSPRDGTWAITSDTNGCLYVGGDFHVGGVDTGTPRWLGGFGKFCTDPDQPPAGQILLDVGQSWRYDDSGADLGTAWRSTMFDDQGWPVGATEIGFGDGDEATVVNAGNTTYYARTTFDHNGGALPPSLELSLKADDGAAVYLNGVEVLRDNLPDGPLTAETKASTWRAGAAEGFATHIVSADALVKGTNSIAVEVHNIWSGNSDLGFDLRIASSTEPAPPGPDVATELIAPRSSWHHADSTAGEPADWQQGLPAPADPAQFGFGEGDEATELTLGAEAYYFTSTFDMADAAAVSQLDLSLLADDGAVVYLNGTEILRANMPAGPISPTSRPLQWVSGADETFVDHSIPKNIFDGVLTDGQNTVAVEIHNYWPGNPDLSFDLSLGSR